MGCAHSKNTLFDHDPTKFKVINIDGEGKLRKPGGFIEITDTDLIYFYRGKIYTTWPLIYIKRYGFDVGTFTFQSGRRCGDRAGNFAFHCDRAKELFELLQARIQVQTTLNETSSGFSRPTSDVPNTTMPNSKSLNLPGSTRNSIETNHNNDTSTNVIVKRTQSLGVNRLPDILNIREPLSPSACTPLAESNNNTSSSLSHLYTNTNTQSTEASLSPGTQQNYANVDNVPIQVSVEAETCRYYINVTPGAKDLLSPNIPMHDSSTLGSYMNCHTVLSLDDEDARHCYANLDIDERDDAMDMIVNEEIRKFNYITLDLEQSKESNGAIKCSNHVTTTEKLTKITTTERIVEEVVFDGSHAMTNGKKPLKKKGYAVIDYDKTVALSNSVNPSQEIDNEGSRKTRHNSTISDLSATLCDRQRGSTSD